jgi:hypothetical protein
MHRIGRDNQIIMYQKHEIQCGDLIVLTYGEVDCRCHIQRQVDLGIDEDTVISQLVENYFRTIHCNTEGTGAIILIMGVIPQTRQCDYEKIHGPIAHEFPFVGSDQHRVRYTGKVNEMLEAFARKNGYFYLNPYLYYTRPDGTLKHELSDTNVHLGDNTVFLEQFVELYEKIIPRCDAIDTMTTPQKSAE